MRPISFLVLAVVLILGLLVGQAALSGVPYKGQEADHVLAKGQGQRPGNVPGLVQHPSKVRSKPGFCPRILMKCAMMNPPNACMRDSECTGNRKCCVGSCGRVCMKPQRNKN